jgi:hypothetical protein
MLLEYKVATLKVNEATKHALETQRVNRELRGNSRIPYAQNAIKATATFTKKLFNWISQLPCEFRKRFAISQNTGFSECG